TTWLTAIPSVRNRRKNFPSALIKVPSEGLVIMQQHPYSVLASEQVKGQLIFTPCPGTKDTSVAEALDTLKEAGASALLTLMPSDELAQHEVENLPEQCRQRDIE